MNILEYVRQHMDKPYAELSQKEITEHIKNNPLISKKEREELISQILRRDIGDPKLGFCAWILVAILFVFLLFSVLLKASF